MTFDPRAFAADLSKELVALLESRKEELIADAGGWPRRAAVRMAWPTLIGEVPPVTEALITMVAERFGKLTVDELLAALQKIRSSVGPAEDDAHVPQSRA